VIGRTLGHFRIDETIGQGGMGVVYRARDLHLDRDVAIKVLPPGLLVDDIARRRLRREALALSRLHHPGIAVVHDFDTSEGTDFLVMELVPGGTLATRLAAGPLSIPDALRIAIEVADVLESAHTSGVIHRDLKPSNIMFSWGGHAMVLDFGLARRALDAGEATIALTETQSVLGTLHYMAPEQLRGETAGPRTDVYALGVVLYEMVTGALPHDEVSAIAYAGAVLNQPPVAPGIRRADLPHGLEAVILRALEKDPAERHPSARKVAEALGAVASSGITRPHVAEPHAAPTPVPATHRPRPASVLPVMALVSIAVLLALLGTWLFRPRATPGGSIRSLAVLPLANLSGDPRQEYFADGMTDELIEDLSQIRALKVISRTSAMSYKGCGSASGAEPRPLPRRRSRAPARPGANPRPWCVLPSAHECLPRGSRRAPRPARRRRRAGERGRALHLRSRRAGAREAPPRRGRAATLDR
jgi:serine/threonine protein kinase